MQDKKLIWTETSYKAIGDYRIFQVEEVHRVLNEERQNTFYRIKSAPWIITIPVIKKNGEDHFVLVRQFRHGSGQLTVEFPAGIVDEGEDPRDAALRELAEETAFQAKNITLIGQSNPNPALFDNQMYVFLATDLQALPEQHLDADEAIEVLTLPIREVASRMGKGEMNHALMVMAMYWYQQYRNHTKGQL
ncbi:NUDIX hydrolase [Entomospira entomophila]|uniref:GDP-mannose pyrophosphatase n=1 Tax=Entomospira entomophila TaxID=2719988 RepID=A0A968GBY8_9SPIO|nr:NUDIX hydrolase [Entomospira entomophilus]NIZ40134.1 NUDIX hydrolase [Entomospira entomophilus]WDI35693.1 NUDIX hydrolase [Entomospira entomophilus]